MSLFSFAFTPTAGQITSTPPTLLWYKGAGGSPANTQMTVTTFPSVDTTNGITLMTPQSSDNTTYALWQGMLGPHFTVSFTFKISGNADFFNFIFYKPDTTLNPALVVQHDFFNRKIDINGFSTATNSVPFFRDSLNHTMVITYNHGAVTASIDGITYVNNVYMIDTALAFYQPGAYATRYFGFSAWNGGQTSTIYISNVSITTFVPPWASNTFLPEYSVVSHNTYGYILYGMPYNTNSATPVTVSTISNFTGGWIKVMPTRFARDSRLVNNELFYAFDYGLVLYHDTAATGTATTYHNYNVSTTYVTFARVWYFGSLFINFGGSTTAAPGHSTEVITTPTTTSTWTAFFKLVRITNNGIINANVYIVYLGKVYRVLGSNITFASNTANYLPTNASLYSDLGWAGIAYPSGSLIQYDSNIVYYAYTSSNTIVPSQNTTSTSRWMRLYGSIGGQTYVLNEFVYLWSNNTMYYASTNLNLTSTPTEPNTTGLGWVRLYESITNQIYTLNEFVCLGSTKTVYHALTTTNLTSTPADPNTNGQGWIKAVSGYTGSVGHYIYQLDSGQVAGAYNCVQEQATTPWVEAWTSYRTYTANKVVGHLGTGYAAYDAMTSNNTPSPTTRSNLDVWIPFWSQTGQYLQNDYTFFSNNFYNGFTRPSVGATPLINSSNTTGWIMVYQPTKSYNPNTIVFSETDAALYRSIRLQSTLTPVTPSSDSNNICWDINSIPRSGTIRWSMFRGATISFPSRPTLNPLYYYVNYWLTASTGVSQSGGTITAWADQSGNSRTVTVSPAPTYSATGMQGLPSIIFNNDQGVQVTGGPTTATEFTIGLIGYMTITGTNQTIMRFANAAHFIIRCDTGVRCTTFGTTGTFSASLIQTNTPFIILAKASITNGTSTMNVRINGTSIGNVTGTGTSFDTSTIYFGSSLSVNTAINGGISDFLFINRALSTTELQILEGYMAWTWLGSGASLAVGHPFKSFGPVL